MIERSCVASSFPWVLQDDFLGAVDDSLGKLTPLKEGEVESQIESTSDAGVHVNPHKVLRPFQNEGVEILVVRGVAFESISTSLEEAIQSDERSPVKGRGDIVAGSNVLLVWKQTNGEQETSAYWNE